MPSYADANAHLTPRTFAQKCVLSHTWSKTESQLPIHIDMRAIHPRGASEKTVAIVDSWSSAVHMYCPDRPTPCPSTLLPQREAKRAYMQPLEAGIDRSSTPPPIEHSLPIPAETVRGICGNDNRVVVFVERRRGGGERRPHHLRTMKP